MSRTDVPNFSQYLTPTACDFLNIRGSAAGLPESEIKRICVRDGIHLSHIQAEMLQIFGGLQYRPFGSKGTHSCFSAWRYPEKPYERGFVSHGAQWIGRCFEEDEFGPEGLCMAPDGSLGVALGDGRIVIYSSLTIPIERDAAIWATGQPFAGVIFLREEVAAGELVQQIPGKRIDSATDGLNCVWMCDTSICVWSGWAPAIDRAFNMPTVPGTRLDVFASSRDAFDRIVENLSKARVLNSAARATESVGPQ